MIAFEDCIALCGLTEEEVAAIAEHEHLPEIAAATLARYLINQASGPEEIRNMIVDDIREALQTKRPQHAAELISALRHFLQDHPHGPSQSVPANRN